jgi:hypothetical protein
MKSPLLNKYLTITSIIFFTYNGYSSGEVPNSNLGAVDVTIETTAATCGTNDGEINIELTGGVPPYSIIPSNLTSLSAGNYNITISDSGGCVIDTSVVLEEDNNLSTFVDVLDEISCTGNQLAEVIINVAGGSGQYLVMVEGNPSVSEVSTGIFSTNLSGGSYGITITDINDNCSLVDNFAVGQPSPIVVTVEITEIDSCSGRILMADISAVGGTPPYMIETNPMSDGLEVIVIDSEGCMESVFVENPPLENALRFASIQIFDSESNQNNGSIDITVDGGEPPYFYEWRDSDDNVLTTDEDIEDLSAGVYTVKVSDFSSCTILSGELEVDQMTSTNSLAEINYNIYPNPNSSELLIIESKSIVNSKYKIISATGKTILHGTLNESKNRIMLPELENGVYFLRIFNEAGNYELHPILIMK